VEIDPRLPWPVLVDHAWESWREGFARAWLLRDYPVSGPCRCVRWMRGMSGAGRLEHWACHGLLSRLAAVRSTVVGQLERRWLSAPVSHHHGGPEPTSEPEIAEAEAVIARELDRLDRHLDARLLELPREVAALTAAWEHDEARPEAGLTSFADALAGIVGRYEDEWQHGGTAEPGHVAARFETEATVRRLYSRLGQPEPVVLWASSPRHAETIAEVLLDVCVTASAGGGFVELGLDLAADRHRGRLDPQTLAAVLEVARRSSELAEPARALLPVDAALMRLEAHAVRHLAVRIGEPEDDVATSFWFMTPGDDAAAPAESRLRWAVERELAENPRRERQRATPSDDGAPYDAISALADRGGDELPAVRDVAALRRDLFAWSGMRGAVILTEPPETVRVDAAGRLHGEDDFAVRWADGWGVSLWHGISVPRDLVTDGWGVSRIMAEPNTEVRRCAIERMGWPEFVRAARLRAVGAPAPDPANPGHHLQLYALPPELLDRDRVCVLTCTNASLERDGSRRSYGLFVPDSFSSPLAAAAWTFGLTSEQYARLEAAT